MNKIFKIFYIIIAALIIFIPVFAAIYILRYDILTKHDLIFPFGRTFFAPEHGRYVSTFINNLFTEIIPETLHIHPNDFQVTFMAPFKGIILAVIILFFTQSFFVFGKEKNIIKPEVLNPIFLFSYLTVFFCLFNFNYIFSTENMQFMRIFENMVFFEYPASLIVYATAFSIFGYYFVKNKPIPKLQYGILLFCLFFTGLSVEPINLPVFVTMGLLGLYCLIKRKSFSFEPDSETPAYKLTSPGIYITYLIGTICYYIRPSGHNPYYADLTFSQYLTSEFPHFVKTYFHTFIFQDSYILIFTLVLCLLSLFQTKKRNENKRMTILFTASAFGFLLFYFLIFFIGYIDGFKSVFWCEMDKWVNIYKAITFFWLLFVTGKLIDTSDTPKKIIYAFKTVVMIILLLLLGNLKNYINSVNEISCWYKELRILAYKEEKNALELKEEYIYIPSEYKDKHFASPNALALTQKDDCSYDVYLNLMYPQLHVSEIIFTDDESLYNRVNFSKDELKELKFKNLPTGTIKRHKKNINGCY